MCSSRVSTCMRDVWYQDLDVVAHQEFMATLCTRVYLHT